MLKQIIITLFIIFCSLVSFQGAQEGIEKALASLPRSTKISVSVYDPEANKTIFEHNKDILLKPASNIKIFTTAASLLSLGKDYNAEFCIYYDKGKINKGILEDNIYIKGYGNALITQKDLPALAGKIKKAGIKEITGRIIYDNTFFPKKMPVKNFSSSLSPIDLPAVSPISVNNNIIELIGVNENGNIKYISSLVSKYVSVSYLSTPGNWKRRIRLNESPDGYRIEINSAKQETAGNKLYVFTKSPELLASLLLKEEMEKLDIKIAGNPAAGTVNTDNKEKFSLFTPLSEIIEDINKNSSNFLAETLSSILRSRKAPGILSSLGIDEKGLIIADASGISADNRTTAHSIIKALNLIGGRKDVSVIFKNSLSIAGIDGTLKTRFALSPLKNNFSGKTGFMAGTSSISGYMKTSRGKELIVAIIINYKEKGIDFYRRVEQEILEWLYKKY